MAPPEWRHFMLVFFLARGAWWLRPFSPPPYLPPHRLSSRTSRAHPEREGLGCVLKSFFLGFEYLSPAPRFGIDGQPFGDDVRRLRASRKLGERDHGCESALHDAQAPSARAGDRRLGHAPGGIERRKRDKLIGGSALCADGRADGEVYGILSDFGACEYGRREHVGLGKRTHGP